MQPTSRMLRTLSFFLGFLGKALRVATGNKHHIKTSKESHALRRVSWTRKMKDQESDCCSPFSSFQWTKCFIRSLYVFNMLFFGGCLTYFTVMQHGGEYRCQSVTVSFGDAVWENAFLDTENGTENRLLIYSHFNGIYKGETQHPILFWVSPFLTHQLLD